MVDLAEIRAVTFSCHGVLIDRDAGLRAWLSRSRQLERPWAPTVEAWLARFDARELAEVGRWRSYAVVLADCFDQTMRSFELAPFADGGPSLAYSLAEWPPFADAVPALRKIARRRRVAIVANLDRAQLGQVLGQLLVPLAAAVSAEDVGAFKPDPTPLRRTVELLGCAPGQVLHVASSVSLDLAVARQLGVSTARLLRDPRVAVDPAVADLTVSSLAELATQLA